MFYFDTIEVVAILLIVAGLPLVTTLVTGIICGIKMTGLNWWGGMMIGVASTVGIIIEMVLTYSWFNIDSVSKTLAYGIALLISAVALTAVLCYLWAFLVGRRSYWWRL